MAVYLIRCGEDGPVKIGSADAPQERLAALQTAHWQTLALVRVWQGGETEERKLHRKFSDLHIRGEWFHFSRQMLGDVGLPLAYEAPSGTDAALVHGRFGTNKRPDAKYDAGLRLALNALGGPAKLAAHLNLVPSAVTQWTRIPARHIPRISALTGIGGRALRPDLYPPATEAETAA